MTRKQLAAQKIGQKYGKQNGKRAVESGQLARAVTPESLRKGGQAGGKKNAESGHMREIQKQGCSLGGRARQIQDPGHLRRVTTTETCRKGAHVRWHVNRGIFQPKCSNC